MVEEKQEKGYFAPPRGKIGLSWLGLHIVAMITSIHVDIS